jgi:DNA-binding MarR family transcriptional regulator
VNAGQLHRLARVLREVATADPGESTVSAGDLAITEDVAHHEGTSIGQSAQQTGLAQSLVSKTVAAIWDEGFLTTTPDPSNGRRILVSVDPAIRADVLNSRAARPIDAALSQVRPGTSAAEIQRIDELLDGLTTRLLSQLNLVSRTAHGNKAARQGRCCGPAGFS